MPRQKNTPEQAKLSGQAKRNPKRYENRGSSVPCVKISPNKPAFKNEETSFAWEAIVPSLVALKVLTVQDYPTLDEMFRSYELYIDSCKLLNDFMKNWTRSSGVIDKEFLDMRKSIIVQISTMQNDFNKVASRFGLTPADRARLDIKEVKEENDFDVFLKTFTGQ